MSGSLSSLSKALVTAFSSQEELNDDVLTIVNLYIEKHTPPSENDRTRLHEELLSIHGNYVSGSKTSAFLHVLTMLKHDFIIDPEHCRTWWNLMLSPILNHAEILKQTLRDSLAICLDSLVFSNDDPDFKLRHAAAVTMKSCILESYFSAVIMERRTVIDNLQQLLVTFARRRTQDFFETIDPFLQNPVHRLQCLTLLSTFVRLQTQYIYQIFQTPLLNSILQCLELDGSTTVVSLALTILIMIVPHIPDKLSTMLPRLFHIFGRVLCWDKLASVRRRTAALGGIDTLGESVPNVSIATAQNGYEEGSWRRLDASFDIAYSTPPKCSQYFTFLYGLYPINFLDYLRMPSVYASSHNLHWYIPEDMFDDEMIRSRAEPLVRKHLVHPNFTHLTIDSEVSDFHRWMKLEPSDVVTLCISMDTVNVAAHSRVYEDNIPKADEDIEAFDLEHTGGRSTTSSKAANGLSIDNDEKNFQAPILSKIYEENDQDERSVNMMDSFISEPADAGAASRLASPAFLPSLVIGGLHDQDVSRHSSTSRNSAMTPSDVLRIHEDLVAMERRQSYQTEGITSPISTNDSDLRSVTSHYQREMLLLRNELNFERHLKQQHLQHIGRLQRDIVSDAAVETERQNLYNTTRALKSQVLNLQNTLQRLRNEVSTSKVNRAKYEASLNDRIKKLREEKSSLGNTEETLRAALEEAKSDILNMRMSLGLAEGAALNLRQQLQVLQPEIQAANDLQKNFDLLKERIKDAEIQTLQLRIERERAIEAESKAQSQTLALAALQAEFTEHKRLELLEKQALAIPLAPTSLRSPSLPAGNTDLLNQMLHSRNSKQTKAFEDLESRHKELLGQVKVLKEKLIDYEARLEYEELTAEHQQSVARRPGMLSRGVSNVNSIASPIAENSPMFVGQATGAAAPSVSTSKISAERGTDTAQSLSQADETSSNYVHGARRTDQPLEGRSSAAISASTSPSTIVSSKKKENKEKSGLGGRFRW